jgi:hypothetical protein
VNPVLWTLAIVGPLLLAAVVTFAVFVISIHRTRRASLFEVNGQKRGSISRKAFVTARPGRKGVGE